MIITEGPLDPEPHIQFVTTDAGGAVGRTTRDPPRGSRQLNSISHARSTGPTSPRIPLFARDNEVVESFFIALTVPGLLPQDDEGAGFNEQRELSAGWRHMYENSTPSNRSTFTTWKPNRL